MDKDKKKEKRKKKDKKKKKEKKKKEEKNGKKKGKKKKDEEKKKKDGLIVTPRARNNKYVNVKLISQINSLISGIVRAYALPRQNKISERKHESKVEMK